MSAYHEPGRCSCMAPGSTIEQLDIDCRCACHGPHMVAICCVSTCRKPYGLTECAPGQHGTKTHGYCDACFPAAMAEADAASIDPKAETRRREKP